MITDNININENQELLLSDKYIDFMCTDADVEFLEGTTAAGKTTIGVIKLLFKIAENPNKFHIISGLDLGTIEKNIINKDLGLIDVFGGLVKYNANGSGKYTLPHIIYHTETGDKVIYILGYDNSSRWKKALGGQYGCVYIDEINIADMDYVREVMMRADYVMATLNPDNPNLPIYDEYINKSRPLPKYENDAPKELLNMLNQPPNPNWIWWYFSFEHNLGISQIKKEKIINNVPKGTKLYKNKIKGLRGIATGLVFPNFDRQLHTASKETIKTLVKKGDIKFVQFSTGVDTAYSSKSNDTISIYFIGITDKGTIIILDEKIYNNKNLNIPIAPSDNVINIVDFINRNSREWGMCKYIFIDNADQATITEANKYKREHECLYNFVGSYKGIKIVDRINLQLGWIHTNKYIVLEHCLYHINELEIYSWDEKKDYEPEDANDHSINAVQYAFAPYIDKIGEKEE